MTDFNLRFVNKESDKFIKDFQPEIAKWESNNFLLKIFHAWFAKDGGYKMVDIYLYDKAFPRKASVPADQDLLQLCAGQHSCLNLWMISPHLEDDLYLQTLIYQ